MDQMSHDRPSAGAGDPDLVADELERLHAERVRRQAASPEQGIPVDRVEAVLQRAVELDATDPPPRRIDADALADVAAEIGIDEMALRRAYAEEEAGFAPQTELGMWDRLLGPDRIAETRIVSGTTEVVAQDAEVWFRRHEALRLRTRSDAGAIWEAHQGALNRLRADLVGPAKPTLRAARTVTLQVRPVTGDEQLVSIEADATPLQDRGKHVLAGVAVATAIVAIAGAALTASILGSLFGLAVAWLAIPVVAGFRAAATRLRDGVARALDAIGAAEDVGLRKPDMEHFLDIGRRWLHNFRGVFGRSA